MAITAIRTGDDTFTVVGDQSSIFHPGRRVKMIGDTTDYGTVLTGVYTTLTTVTLTSTSDTVPTNLTGVLYGIISAAEGDCSMPIHDHDGDEGSGGSIDASDIDNFDTEVSNNSDVAANTAKRTYPSDDETKLAGISDGAEVNNISDADASDLTDGGTTTLHNHNGAYEPADTAIVKSDEEETITSPWKFDRIHLNDAVDMADYTIWDFGIETDISGTIYETLIQSRLQPTTNSSAIYLPLMGLVEQNSAYDFSGHSVGVLGWNRMLDAGGTSTAGMLIGVEGKISISSNQTATLAVGVESQISENEGAVTEFIGFHVLTTSGLTNQPTTKYSFKSEMTGGILYNNGVIMTTAGAFIGEIAAAYADITGYGQLWVKNSTPNELWFTDDAGTDFQLGTFTSTLKTKLDGIEVGAEVNVIDDVVDDTTPQLGGDLDYNSNGLKIVGQTIGGSNGDLVYLSGSLTWSQANADAEVTCSGMLGIRISATEVLTQGVYTTTGLTAASTYYASTTAGGITTTVSSTTGDIVRIVGYALSTTEFYFDPDKTFVEVA